MNLNYYNCQIQYMPINLSLDERKTTSLPSWIIQTNSFLQAYVSLKRIAKFLLQEEIDSEAVKFITSGVYASTFMCILLIK